jgi:hypothetical protein
MSKKIYYECGCTGYISSTMVFVRIVSCDEHKDIPNIVKPQSKVINTEITA